MATLWLNRPEVHNAFNPQLIADLTAACRALDANDMVRVVIVAGRGKSFSAGADLNWMKAAGQASVAENLEDAHRLAAMLRTLAELRKADHRPRAWRGSRRRSGLGGDLRSVRGRDQRHVRHLGSTLRHHSRHHRSLRDTRHRRAPGISLLPDGGTHGCPTPLKSVWFTRWWPWSNWMPRSGNSPMPCCKAGHTPKRRRST